MPLLVTEDIVDPCTRTLLGGISVDDGATAAQLAVLRAVVAHLWERPDLDPAALAPLEPDAAASLIVDPEARRRLIELLVTLELCRHPQTESQIRPRRVLRGRVRDRRSGARDRPPLDRRRRRRATEDYDRFYAGDLPQLSEPDLRADYLVLTEPDLELARRLERLHDLPSDTLGYWYIEFYRRNHLVLPGADTTLPAHYVSHDMNHVITGYEPTGPGEIALGAFTLAMNDNDASWLQFMTNLLIHEAGMLKHGAILPKPESLERPGATELLGEAFARGTQCTSDFSQIDHLSMATWPLERRHFNVVPLTSPMF